MLKFSILFVLCYSAVFLVQDIRGASKETCDEEPPSDPGPLPYYLWVRIVEYTTLIERSHSLYPSAAESLLSGRHFNPNISTVIFVHGPDNSALVTGKLFALAYKIHGDYNILGLDSSKLISLLDMRYPALVKLMGEALGVVIYDLVNHGVDINKIHVVGHSLGAHFSGFAGKVYQYLKHGEKIPRITGMDPSGPCFFHAEADERLDKDDASFVDIIHTNYGDRGINKTIGHVSFFPNGGDRQPGCLTSFCSHNRGWQYYKESVNRPDGFIAAKCNSWSDFQGKKCLDNKRSQMGFPTPHNETGTYYLRTNFMIPFGLGSAGARPPVIGKWKNKMVSRLQKVRRPHVFNE